MSAKKGIDLHLVQELTNYEGSKLEYESLQEKAVLGGWLQPKERARLSYLERLITTIDELYDRLPDGHRMILRNAERAPSELAVLLGVSVKRAAKMRDEMFAVFADRMGWNRSTKNA